VEIVTLGSIDFTAADLISPFSSAASLSRPHTASSTQFHYFYKYNGNHYCQSAPGASSKISVLAE